MQQLTQEQENWVNQGLANETTKYQAENDGKSPNGRWVSAVKQSLELQCYPLSEVIRRMIKIGDPDNIHNRDTEKNEFQVLSDELNRREQMYIKAGVQ
jgi:hypothetical protein